MSMPMTAVHVPANHPEFPVDDCRTLRNPATPRSRSRPSMKPPVEIVSARGGNPASSPASVMVGPDGHVIGGAEVCLGFGRWRWAGA